LIVLNDKEAAYYLNDLEQMIGEQDVLFYQVLIAVRTKLKIRTMPMYCSCRVLNRINSRKKPAVVYPEAV
jgi:transcription-repair coupling factor (superfamily II helicase)